MEYIYIYLSVSPHLSSHRFYISFRSRYNYNYNYNHIYIYIYISIYLYIFIYRTLSPSLPPSHLINISIASSSRTCQIIYLHHPIIIRTYTSQIQIKNGIDCV